MANEEINTELETENIDSKEVDTQNAEGEETTETIEENTDSNDLYGAPESYDFKTLELPEGIEYNEEYGNKFSAVAKELNLSQKSANKLANLYVEIIKSQTDNAPEAIKEFQKQQVEADIATWDKAVNQDVEIGNGNKEKVEAYMDKANTGYKAFASDGLKDILQAKGLNHHPEVIKLFYKLSDLTGDDKILTGGNITKEESPAEILYGKKA